MKKKKRFLSALLAAALVCTACPQSAQAVTFQDVPANAWYRSYVYDLVEKGVIHGTSATEFSPGKKLTRAAFATMLAQAALSEGDLRQYEFQGSFQDVTPKHWAYRYINWAAEAGIVSGYENKTFRPDKPVSRQEMAVMTVNFAKATGRQMNAINEVFAFTDSGSIARFAASSVRICQQAGVMVGDKVGTFRPNDTATRAEAATMYSNFLKNCQIGTYKVVRKRVFTTPVRAVEFSSSDYTPQLIMGHDRVTGAESPTSIVNRTEAKIAVNAAFFDMSSYIPLGTLVKDGQVLTVADRYAPARSALVVDSSGHFSIQNFTTNHTVTLHKADETDSVLYGVSVNRSPSGATDATRILFTRAWGKSLGFPAKDAVTLAEDGTILDIAKDTDVQIPETGYVLAQRSRRKYEGDFFDSCTLGAVLDIERVFEGAGSQDIQISIGAGPRIVKDKAVYGGLSTYQAEGYTDPGITTYEALRVCFGIKADGSLVICTAYATLAQMSKIMVSFGCTDAINFDGGGSANLYVDGQWLRGPQDRPLNSTLIFK